VAIEALCNRKGSLKPLLDTSAIIRSSLACAVDICRAAAYIDPEGDVPLRLVASDIADEIKVSYERFSCHENHVPIYCTALGRPLQLG
jgi:hypothetical protein